MLWTHHYMFTHHYMPIKHLLNTDFYKFVPLCSSLPCFIPSTSLSLVLYHPHPPLSVSVHLHSIPLLLLFFLLSSKGAQADLLAAGILQHILGAEPCGYIKWGSNSSSSRCVPDLLEECSQLKTPPFSPSLFPLF